MVGFSKGLKVFLYVAIPSLVIIIVLAAFPFGKTGAGVQKSLKAEDCITLHETNPNLRGVVFLPYGYGDMKSFLEDATYYVNGTFGILGVKPFSESKDKLNFYAVYRDEVSCGIEESTLVCDDESAKKAALSCPNDYIFVIGSRNNFLNFINPIRSSSYINLASINTADHRLVVPHEFGHTFGRLADEYVEEGLEFSANAYKNCDTIDCPKWASFAGAGCFRGCGSINLYRSTETGIMKNYFESQTYGVYNEWLLNNTLYS